jgi:hypothetical protein
MPGDVLTNLVNQAKATPRQDYGYQVDCKQQISMNLEVSGLKLKITQEHLVRKDNGVCTLAVFELQKDLQIKWILGQFES